MPLSEDEKRILTEIEQHLYASDPDLARQVSSTTVYSHGLRRVRWSIAGLLLGLVGLVLLLPVSYIASFVVGFGVMLIATWHLERSLRHLGKAGIRDVARGLREAGVRDYFNHAGERARERFRRDDED